MDFISETDFARWLWCDFRVSAKATTKPKERKEKRKTLLDFLRGYGCPEGIFLTDFDFVLGGERERIVSWTEQHKINEAAEARRVEALARRRLQNERNYILAAADRDFHAARDVAETSYKQACAAAKVARDRAVEDAEARRKARVEAQFALLEMRDSCARDDDREAESRAAESREAESRAAEA